jgi:hypothetical protein
MSLLFVTPLTVSDFLVDAFTCYGWKWKYVVVIPYPPIPVINAA